MSHLLDTVLALTVKIRKSQDFLAPISGSPGDQIFSLTFRNSTSIFLNSHLWSKTTILFVLRFYGPFDPVGSCQARSVYLTTR